MSMEAAKESLNAIGRMKILHETLVDIINFAEGKVGFCVPERAQVANHIMLNSATAVEQVVSMGIKGPAATLLIRYVFECVMAFRINILPEGSLGDFRFLLFKYSSLISRARRGEFVNCSMLDSFEKVSEGSRENSLKVKLELEINELAKELKLEGLCKKGLKNGWSSSMSMGEKMRQSNFPKIMNAFFNHLSTGAHPSYESFSMTAYEEKHLKEADPFYLLILEFLLCSLCLDLRAYYKIVKLECPLDIEFIVRREKNLRNTLEKMSKQP